MTRVRFAVAPAGHLGLGAARVAVANLLFARRHAGQMLLRFDDTEPERCRPDYAEAIAHDLQWIGIVADTVVHQSERLDLYADAIERLKRAGRLYPCFESPEELRAKRERRLKRGQSAVYDRAMLRLTETQRAAAEAGGKRPYWRFRLSDGVVQWRDAVLGPRLVKLQAVSDPVVVRADGTNLPLLTSVVDDIALGISHVIRAEDHITATGLQRDLFAALDADLTRIVFAHLPPLRDGSAERLSRRAAARTVRSLRSDGIEPAALLACLARLGSGLSPEALPIAQLAETFDLSALSRAPVPFDAAQLLVMNRSVLARSAFAAVADRLPHGATEAFWLAVRDHLDLLNEARGWWDVVAGTIVPPVIEDAQDILPAALKLLPAEPWNSSICAAWIDTVCAATGRAREAVFQALRLALTGEEQGPKLDALLPLIGRARTANRLQTAAT